VEKPKNGVRDAREAKALVPSALYWSTGQDHMPSQTATLLQHAIRDPDPHFQVHEPGWSAPRAGRRENRNAENKRDKRLAWPRPCCG